jgi:malate dehydrogenase
MKKIAIIGAGKVGMSAAYMAVQRELANEIALIDIKEGLAKGLELDINQTSPIRGISTADAWIKGSEDFANLKGAGLVMVTAGFPRKPGMDRIELLGINGKIIKGIGENIKKYCPDAFVIVVTNPIDVMAMYMYTVLGSPKTKVIGQAGVLDSARFAWFIAEELGVSVKDVNTLVLGGHGDSMVPVLKYTTVGGVPVQSLIPPAKLDEIIKRTQVGGGEIVKLLGYSAFFAPAASTVAMAEGIIRNTGRVLPCSVYLDGEYGISGTFVGVPVKLGFNGVEKILDVELEKAEITALQLTADSYKKAFDELISIAE